MNITKGELNFAGHNNKQWGCIENLKKLQKKQISF